MRILRTSSDTLRPVLRIAGGAVILALGIHAAVAQQRTFLGKVEPLPNTVVQVIAPDTGKITPPGEKFLVVGDQVKKGQPLATLQHAYNLHDYSHLTNARWDFERDMVEARYEALEAKIERERAERLKTLGSVSGQDLQELKAAEQVAQAEYEKRKNLLQEQDDQISGKTLVSRPMLSPIDGEISQANYTQGQMIPEGFALFKIVNLSAVRVSAHVPEAEFKPWPAGTTAKIRFDGIPDKVFTGKLEQILPVVDAQSRARDVLFRVENPGELLRFGMVGQVEVQAP